MIRNIPLLLIRARMVFRILSTVARQRVTARRFQTERRAVFTFMRFENEELHFVILTLIYVRTILRTYGGT
jgi:hypothetical protein